MVLQGLSQDRELGWALRQRKVFLGFQHDGGGSPEGHLGMAPALDIALDQAEGAVRILDDFRAGERTSEFLGQVEFIFLST